MPKSNPGFMAGIDSRGHRLLIDVLKRNKKIDGMGLYM